MLLRFGVENHRSIATYQEISMVATSLKDSDRGLFTIVGRTKSDLNDPPSKNAIRVSPVAGIYGANASGKSTVLSALTFFCQGIVTSHSRMASREGTPHYPYRLDEESHLKPSKYDADIILDSTRYHYGYSLDGKKIINEWLYSFDLSSTRQARTVLFVRETNEDLVTEYKFGKSLKGANKQISKFVRANSLFLSAAAQNSHPQLTPLFEFFYKKVVPRIENRSDEETISEQLSAYFGSDSFRQSQAIEFLKEADIGITGIDFSKVPIGEKVILMLQEFEQILNKHVPSTKTDDNIVLSNRKEKAKVNLFHVGKLQKSYPIELKRESEGTLSLLQLLGPTFARLREGGLLIVDELNSTLHPLVSRALIRLFLNPDTNPGKAQLLFTTHDTNLLTGKLLRRDQIWFAEKDGEGATHTYSLSSIKVRADDNFERGYLVGRFGAVPFFTPNLREFEDSFVS